MTKICKVLQAFRRALKGPVARGWRSWPFTDENRASGPNDDNNERFLVPFDEIKLIYLADIRWIEAFELIRLISVIKKTNPENGFGTG